MNKKLDAILACRLKGTRLYGKPLQLLDIEKEVTILENCIRYLKEAKSVQEICLAISEEEENKAFLPLVEKHGWKYVLGDPKDVLGRIVKATKLVGSDHVLRVTSECPFVFNREIDSLFHQHVQEKSDYTSLEKLPEGSVFEIISVDALRKSHDQGSERNRSELVTSYIFENQEKFRISRPMPDKNLQRPEVRITVDYPEDLIFCRKVYRDLGGRNRLISIEEIIQYWDKHPELRKPLEEIGIDWGTGRLWA